MEPTSMSSNVFWQIVKNVIKVEHSNHIKQNSTNASNARYRLYLQLKVDNDREAAVRFTFLFNVIIYTACKNITELYRDQSDVI